MVLGPLLAVRDMINTLKKQQCDDDHDVRFDDLLDVVMEFQKRKGAMVFSFLSGNVITALVDAMAFEPATALPSGELVYSVEAPSTPVDRYLCDFIHGNDESIVCSNCKLAVFLGPTSLHAHTFMIGEGTRSCVACQRIYCRMCVSSDAGLCIPCLGVGGGVNIEDSSVANLSEADLRHALSEKIEVPASLPIGDLQELYINVVENNSMDSLGSFLLKKVPFPIYYPSIALNRARGNLKYLLSFDFHDGGRFLCSHTLSTKQRCGLINLFVCLVTFHKAESSTLPKAATVLPCIISDFAKNARVDSGERLMKRAIRHALDTKTPPVLHAQGCVIEHDDDIGLVIEDKIAASMKDDIYNVKVGFTSSKLLVSACDCKAGAEAGSETAKHICVHCLPVLYKLTLMLFACLAEHLLIEFASCFTRHHETELSEEETSFVLESILTLMEASMGAGRVGEALSLAKTPIDVLSQFSVGTELSKNKLPEPPNPAELRPLREFKRISPERKAAKLVLRIKQEPSRLLSDSDEIQFNSLPPQRQPTSENEVSNIPSSPLQALSTHLPTQLLAASEERRPDYVTISRLCRVKFCHFGNPNDNNVPDETEVVGLRLLELRAENPPLTAMAG